MATISKVGPGIKVVASGVTTFFYNPVVTAAPVASGLSFPDGRTNLIEIQEDDQYLLLALSEITFVGGNAPAGTVAGVADQILALTV